MSHKFDMEKYGVTVLSKTTGINGTSVGTATTLYTVPVPASQSAVITGINARLSAITGFVSVATLSVGTNVTFDDIATAIVLTGLSATNKFFAFPVSGAAALVTAGTTIKVQIDTAFVATTATLTVELLGYLI